MPFRTAHRGQAGGQRHLTERERRKEKGEWNRSDRSWVFTERMMTMDVHALHRVRVSVCTLIKAPVFINVERED